MLTTWSFKNDVTGGRGLVKSVTNDDKGGGEGVLTCGDVTTPKFNFNRRKALLALPTSQNPIISDKKYYFEW